MEEPTSRKKRARTSESADGDDKKRGRPRVEKQDESAADVGPSPLFCYILQKEVCWYISHPLTP